MSEREFWFLIIGGLSAFIAVDLRTWAKGKLALSYIDSPEGKQFEYMRHRVERERRDAVRDLMISSAVLLLGLWSLLGGAK